MGGCRSIRIVNTPAIPRCGDVGQQPCSVAGTVQPPYPALTTTRIATNGIGGYSSPCANNTGCTVGSCTACNRGTWSRRHLRARHWERAAVSRLPLSIPCAYFKQPLLCESFSVLLPLFRIFNKLSSACNTPVMATPHTEG